jgi:hypothetical protein
MKKIKAFITTEKTDSALSALGAVGIQAAFYESKGKVGNINSVMVEE